MARAFSVFRFNLLLLLNVIVVVSAGRRLQENLKVKAVNLGGWLVVERWIKPSLFDGIVDKDLLDGAQVQFRSLSLGKYVSAENGGGQNVVVNRDNPSDWETFKLWRVSDGKYQFKVFNGQFIKAENGGGGQVSATTTSPSTWETFTIIRHPEQLDQVHIKALNGMYLQAVSQDKLTADYPGDPGWESNAATFHMNINGSGLGGDFQLANGYGPEKAKEIYDTHRQQFVTEDDFKFLAENGINTVRIPVGWWIKYDPNPPPPPFIGGSLAALDNAFGWSQTHNLKVIVDLHAAPGSQNGMEHSASRDGSADWASSSQNISQSLEVIDFLASRYSKNPALLGIELLNEPMDNVPIEVLSSYYAQGYKIVRKHTPTAYVILCQRIGKADPLELFKINGISSGAVVDLHYYNLFTDDFNDKSAQQNIDYIVNKRQPEVESLSSANGGPLVFVGEWTNEWKAEGASKKDYQRFGDAQLQAYGKASFGWAFWTLKNAEKHWDFKWNIQNQYLNRGSK